MSKKAKTASKNSPTNRGSVSVNLYNGQQVVKVKSFKRVNGSLNEEFFVAVKDLASSGKDNLFVVEDGHTLTWSEMKNKNKFNS